MNTDRTLEIIERLARMEEKLNNIESKLSSTAELTKRHETDIQRAKGVLGFLSLITTFIAIKGFIK